MARVIRLNDLKNDYKLSSRIQYEMGQIAKMNKMRNGINVPVNSYNQYSLTIHAEDSKIAREVVLLDVDEFLAKSKR